MSATTATNLTKPWWDVSALDPAGTPSANGATKTALAPAGGWQNMAVDTNATPLAMPGNASTNSAMAGGYTGNPWQNYNDPASNSSWNYTQDPNFNAAADKPNWDLAQTGAKSETDRARVWRWTLDDLKAKGLDPGKADQATVQQAYLANIQRLKNDYQANGMNWAGSAYAGYDQYLPGSQGGTGGTKLFDGPPIGQPGYINGPSSGLAGAASGGTQAGQAAASAAAQGQGGTVDPTAGGGAQTAGALAGQSVPGTTTPPANNSSAPLGMYYKSNPAVAVNDFLQSHNIGIGDHGPFAEFLRKLATGIETPVMSILGNSATGQSSGDQLSNLPGLLSSLIYGNGGQVAGNLANFGTQSMGQFTPGVLKGMLPSDVQGLLSTINALKSFGDNPYMQGFKQQQLSDIFSTYNQADKNKAISPGGGSIGGDYFLNPQNDPYGLFK